MTSSPDNMETESNAAGIWPPGVIFGYLLWNGKLMIRRWHYFVVGFRLGWCQRNTGQVEIVLMYWCGRKWLVIMYMRFMSSVGGAMWWQRLLYVILKFGIVFIIWVRYFLFSLTLCKVKNDFLFVMMGFGTVEKKRENVKAFWVGQLLMWCWRRERYMWRWSILGYFFKMRLEDGWKSGT